jgi:F0F1-type ATP synthase membrane subunit b/b'
MKQLKEDAEAMLADAKSMLDEIDEELDALEDKAREQGVPIWD